MTLDASGCGPPTPTPDVQVHLFIMLAMFVLSFFAFTLALRQFNHFCIMIGAIDHSGHTSASEIDAIAQLNSLAAKNFNNGIRAYYFSVPTVAWFARRMARDRASVVTVAFLIHREFFSSAHRIAASAAVMASRREIEKVGEPSSLLAG